MGDYDGADAQPKGGPERTVFGFTPYQWLVLAAAWLGWGFDVFDALLFNFVSRLCIPSLLGIDPNGASASAVITFWTGVVTSVLLIGWGLGGIVFGVFTDRIGRSKTLLLTMTTYALATAACAAAPNIWFLLFFRFIASLGIGGEWAAGAALVAESVPAKRREIAGALLGTAAPVGLFLATFVTDLFTRQLTSIASDSELAWRLVFLTGLIPAAVAVVVRWAVREPEGWEASRDERPTDGLRALFRPPLRRRTVGGVALAAVALITWWSVSAFIPPIAGFLAADSFVLLGGAGAGAAALADLKARCITYATTAFNLGGLVGTLLTVPAALYLGRRRMFAIYFAVSAAAVWITFSSGVGLSIDARLTMFALVGVSLFGVFGAFTFYLPELFPPQLRGTGSGFCYNAARFVTAAGPFIVATVTAQAASTAEILDTVRWVALVPLLGCLLLAAGVGEERPQQ